MTSLALFDDANWQNLAPITLTRPTFDVKVGAKTYFEEYASPPEYLLTREYLAATTRARHTQCLVNPHSVDGDTIFVNGLMHPAAGNLDRLSAISHNFAIYSGDRLLAGRLGKKGGEYLASCIELGKRIDPKKINAEKSTDLKIPDTQGLVSNLWDIIANLKNSLSMQVADPMASGDISDSVKVLGNGRVVAAKDAEIEAGTVLDATGGGIFIGSQARVAPSRIVGPAYIDGLTQIKQFSIIDASYIGYNCRVSGEIEHSIVSDHTNKAHAGFLGHSYVGEWVNIGAMTTTSDLKMTYGNIKMDNGAGKKADTCTNKLGSFIGDMTKTSIGTLIYSGRRIGVAANLHGLVSRDVPSFTILGSGIGSANVELELDSALETQRRVMARRNQKMTKACEDLITHVFSMTAAERRKNRIRKSRFSM